MKSLYPIIATLAITATTAFATQAAACHDYVIISARGTSEPQGPSGSFLNMTSWTFGNVSRGIEYDVVYPATFDLDHSPYIGANDTIEYIKNGSVACPDQKYALLGYSQGAWVQLLAIRNITGTPLEPLISAIITIGNPFQIPGQPITVDQNGGNTSRNGAGEFLGTDPTLGFSKHWVDSGKVKNICFFGDPVCDVLKIVTGDVEPHLEYVQKSVQEQGAQWLVSHLEKCDEHET